MLTAHLSVTQTLICQTLTSSGGGPGQDLAARLRVEIGRGELGAEAEACELSPMLAHRWPGITGDDPPDAWHRAHEDTGRRITAYLAELDRIACRFAESGIPLVALKNGGIARGIYPCPGCCPMGDLDVLIERRHFRAAHQILLGEDYHFEFRSPIEEAGLQAAEANGSAEYWKMLPGDEKLWFELQWRPVAGRWIRPDQEPSAEELLARSIPIPGTAVRLLAPEDNLLQVALHTAKHSYVRAPGFRLHLDVERIVAAYPDLDWDRFLTQVAALRAKTAVYLALAIPQALFATPVPPQVLEALRPSAAKAGWLWRQIERAGLFEPNQPKFGRVGYILFTALLYDDAAGLWRAIFPEAAWMRERYRLHSNRLMLYYYARRLVDLALRRART